MTRDASAHLTRYLEILPERKAECASLVSL